MKDWTGNSKSIYSTLGATNHSEELRARSDFYATDPRAVDRLLKNFTDLHQNVWEPACGEGHISQRLVDRGYEVRSSDIIVRSYPMEQIDFLSFAGSWGGDIVTNPPYSLALEFAQKAIDVIEEGRYVIMFLKIQFLETKKRMLFFKKHPPRQVMVFHDRITVAKNGYHKEFEKSSAVCYAWYVWQKGHKGPTILNWI